MHLMLASQELEVLLWAIKGVISDLRAKIDHTENQAMQKDLQMRKEVLSVIHARLGFPT